MVLKPITIGNKVESGESMEYKHKKMITEVSVITLKRCFEADVAANIQ